MAFESLTEKLQNVFKNLRSKGRLTEADVKFIVFVEQQRKAAEMKGYFFKSEKQSSFRRFI